MTRSGSDPCGKMRQNDLERSSHTMQTGRDIVTRRIREPCRGQGRPKLKDHDRKRKINDEYSYAVDLNGDWQCLIANLQ